MEKRSLSDEEQRIWEWVTRADVKLDDRQYHTDDGKKNKKIIVTSRPSSAISYLPDNDTPLSAAPVYAGIDHHTARRFRKGELPLDGVLDMHGMTREKAHVALSGFIRNHYERGSRFLLVITGKGLPGVLRELFPHWLSEPGLRPFLLTYSTAMPKHGGRGAYYILLRRNRHD